VTLNLTFPIVSSVAYPYTYVVTEDSSDSNGVLSPLEYLGTLAVPEGTPSLILTTVPSPVVAPLGQWTTFQVNLVGVNGLTAANQLTLSFPTGVGSMAGVSPHKR
jgi:hypothetical protein